MLQASTHYLNIFLFLCFEDIFLKKFEMLLIFRYEIVKFSKMKNYLD